MLSVRIVRHPVDVFYLYFTEGPAFDSEYLLKEFRLSEHVIVIVVATEDPEGLEHVLNVHGEDRGLPRNFFDRQLHVLIPEQQVQHAVCPVRHVGTMPEVAKRLLRGTLLLFNQ